MTRLSISAYWRTFPEWKLKHVKALHQATYSAAIALTDEEIEAVVRDAVNRARMALSS